MAEVKNKTKNTGSEMNIIPFLISMGLFWVTVIATAFLCYFLGCSIAELIRNIVVEVIVSATFFFLLSQSKELSLFSYENKCYYSRIVILYFLGIAIMIACIFLPVGGWPMVPLFVAFSLFTNPYMGLMGGSIFLIGDVLFTGAGIGIFLLYFVTGFVAISLFSHLDAYYRTAVPVIVSLATLLLMETAELVLFENAILNFEQFLIPFANVTISFLFLLVLLKIFSTKVIFKTREKYAEINDPECSLLVELKEKNTDAYFKAIHVSYFCDKISKKLSFDDDACKCGGLYHEISMIREGDAYENILQITKEYHFPEKAADVLKEYTVKNGMIRSKEAGVLYFCDAIISSILYLMHQGQKKDIQYDAVIEAVFEKRKSSPRFNESGLSVNELRIMKQIFKDERLYYELLH